MRIMVAGTGSGCGKTTASLVLMAALRQRGMEVAPYKAGPDYIDPGFHAAVCGRASHNLDEFLMDADALAYLLDTDADIGIIEGVMGFYDGLDVRTFAGSSWALAKATKTPVLLVVDASGGAASVAAQVLGFTKMREDSGIVGVLPTRVSGASHYALIRDAVAHHTGLPCAGYLGKDARLSLQSRHLGLVPAEETPGIVQRVEQAARDAAKTLDLDLICALAAKAPEADGSAQRQKLAALGRPLSGMRLGVARDMAFSFYYEANLNLLQKLGAELVFFSPMSDPALPEGLSALYFGGGFPEVFAKNLEENTSMRRSVRAALENGMRCYGECGGLLYLSKSLDGHEMVGFLPANARMTERLQRFGYVYVEDRTGLRFPAHEFHHALCEPAGTPAFAYRVQKASNPARTWDCGFECGGTLGAFAHLHFLSHPELIGRLFA